MTALWYMQNRQGYICGRYRKHGIQACSSHVIREMKLKELILKDLREMVSITVNKSDFLQKANDKIKRIEKEVHNKQQRITKEIEMLKIENKNLLRLLAQGTITQEEYRTVADENQQKVQDLEQQFMVLNKQLNHQTDYFEVTSKIMKYVDKILEFQDLNEELLHRIIERIDVKENKDIVINYRFANPYSNLM
ncbi:zinc ribbon domain-containing protein [Bacillus sp. ISL-75]|uniref:zinc ribbon domain-containing protein n=1 Tax=Bacillus sp. ISL-75 TaxID=2819137 RepID=UPI001C19156C|nr:zinc ribbon domain-containing protein [Bacillus sp. ISL-75]